MEKREDQKETPTETNAREIAELRELLAKQARQFDGIVNQLFQNQQSMKGGLDAAETNLRTFQKVINGMQEGTLLLIPVPDPPPQSEVILMPKINWPEYYKLTEVEMKAMEASARELEMAKRKAQIKILVEDKKLSWLKERILKQISEEKVDTATMANHMQNASRFFEEAERHIELAQKGELYDTRRLDQLIQMITVAERKAAEENGADHQDETPAEALGKLSDEDSEHDGDTTVFGGDVKEVHEAHDD